MGTGRNVSDDYWKDRASSVEVAWLKCLDAATAPIPIPESCPDFDALVQRAAQGEYGPEAFAALKELCDHLPMYDLTAAIDGFPQQSPTYRALGPIIMTLTHANRRR